MLPRDLGRCVLPAEIEQDLGFRFLQAQPPRNPRESLAIVRLFRPTIRFVARSVSGADPPMSDAARRIFSMSNPSAIRTASTSRFTLSTFTLRTDAVTYFSPGDGFR